MANKKNQHFVPRFYLKRFSKNNDEKSINIFLPTHGRFIESASLADQASRNYYYGRDGLIENSLSVLEGKWSTVLKSITEGDLPEVGSERFSIILDFICFTDFRNPYRADQIESLSEIQGSAVKSLYKVMQEEKIHESEKFVAAAQTQMKENKVTESLLIAKRAVSIISDLKMKLLVNETTKPLLTSDCPVVQYNQYFERQSKRHIPFGLGSWGTQIFVPLNGKQAIILYDKDRYLVGNEKSDFVVIKNPKDVDQLNILQYQNCLNAVYGNELLTQEYAEFLNKRSRKFKNNHGIKHTIVEDTPTSNTVFMKPHNIRCELDLPFIALPLSASKNRLNPGTIYVRPEVEKVRQAMDVQERATQISFKEFLKTMHQLAMTQKSGTTNQKSPDNTH